jgi:hypothetical protein
MLEKDGETKVLCFLITGKDSGFIFYPCALLFQMPQEANPFGIGISLFEAIPSVTKEMYSLARYLTKKTDRGRQIRV